MAILRWPHDRTLCVLWLHDPAGDNSDLSHSCHQIEQADFTGTLHAAIAAIEIDFRSCLVADLLFLQRARLCAPAEQLTAKVRLQETTFKMLAWFYFLNKEMPLPPPSLTAPSFLTILYNIIQYKEYNISTHSLTAKLISYITNSKPPNSAQQPFSF